MHGMERGGHGKFGPIRLPRLQNLVPKPITVILWNMDTVLDPECSPD